MCRHAEEKPNPELNAEELVTALRLCAGTECEGCPCAYIAESSGNCNDYVKRQAADMLEKLAAEKDAKKPEWISVKDRLPEKKHEAYLCSLDSSLFPGSQYVSIREFCDDGEWEAHGTVTHWMPLPELPQEGER